MQPFVQLLMVLAAFGIAWMGGTLINTWLERLAQRDGKAEARSFLVIELKDDEPGGGSGSSNTIEGPGPPHRVLTLKR